MQTRSGERAGYAIVPHLLIHCCSKTVLKCILQLLGCALAWQSLSLVETRYYEGLLQTSFDCIPIILEHMKERAH